MRVIHFMKKENSGLAYTTLEIVAEEERQGHIVAIKEPSGGILYGQDRGDWDIEIIHSQLPLNSYHNGRPRIMVMHGEPISSVGNGVSMKAICDLAPLCNAFICMRKEELVYWSAIKKTHLVNKGIDLEMFKPLPVTSIQKLSGSPAVLLYENWRGQRNPLPLVIAMIQVWRRNQEARLHLYNATDKRLFDTFQSLVKEAKLGGFVRSLQGPVKPTEVNELINRADIVVSCLGEVYARSIEAFGAGKGFVCPGYRDPEYPFLTDMHPDSMAKAIEKIWSEGCGGKFDFRDWAVRKHNIVDTVHQMVDVYKRYI